ncbi:MAG: hypothetical protein J6P20_03365 [Oscillospiraceae bacterium]|nr:hypothetical protein [Oscillospiraceae bacterium]
MSLLDEHKEDFAFMDKAHTVDEEGNAVVSWSQSEATFKASIRFDSSVQAKRAQAEGVQDLYTLIVSKDIDLEYNDVVKRIDDGTTYRITTSGKDNKTPDSAGLNMRAVSAKVWVIPDD